MPSVEKISVTIASDMLSEVREAVQNGEFASTSEALRDALRVWQRQRRDDAERLHALSARVRRSLDDPRPDLDEAEVERHLADVHAETTRHHDAKA